MKKGILLTVFCFFALNAFSATVPESFQNILLAKSWNGFMTNDSTGGANGYKQMTLNFVRDEQNNLVGTITIYGVKVGNGVFNASEFLAIDYETLEDAAGVLKLSYLDPSTRINRDTFTMKATTVSPQVMTGLLYVTTYKGTFKIGTFRVQ